VISKLNPHILHLIRKTFPRLGFALKRETILGLSACAKHDNKATVVRMRHCVAQLSIELFAFAGQAASANQAVSMLEQLWLTVDAPAERRNAL